MVHLVHDEQRAPTPGFAEVQVGGRGHALIRGHVAGQAAARIWGVVGRAHTQAVPQRRAPVWVGEGLLGLQAQAVARHDPDHPLDEPCSGQGMGGQHRQQRLAAARRHRGQDVAHVRARRDRLRNGKKLALVRAERARHSLARTHDDSTGFFRY